LDISLDLKLNVSKNCSDAIFVPEDAVYPKL